MMKVSVITVCYNAEEDIEKTLLSVIKQSYKDFEYIVVDGKSKDRTMEIVNRYSKRITRMASELDTGIYNAMNKGVRMATGDYCIFMNAGDTFAGAEVLKQVVPFLTGEFDVIVGREISIERGKIVNYNVPPAMITSLYLYQSSLCHQASFIKREVLAQYPYDENLRMVSDWKFWIETLLIHKLSYRSVDINICCFNHEGITYTQTDIGKKERKRILTEYMPLQMLKTCQKETEHFSVKWLLFRIGRKIERIINLKRLKDYNIEWYL